jgi:hypothetical protein
MTKPIDKEFALSILQAHIRNATELGPNGEYGIGAVITDETLREAVIASVLRHTSKLVTSIYENPAAYGLAKAD